MSLIYSQSIIDKIAKGPYKMDNLNGQSANVAWYYQQDPSLLDQGIQYADVFPEGDPNAGAFSINSALAYSASSTSFYDQDFDGLVSIQEYAKGDPILEQLARAVDENGNGFIDIWEDTAFTMFQDASNPDGMDGIVTKKEVDDSIVMGMYAADFVKSSLTSLIQGHNLETRTNEVLADLTAQIMPLTQKPSQQDTKNPEQNSDPKTNNTKDPTPNPAQQTTAEQQDKVKTGDKVNKHGSDDDDDNDDDDDKVGKSEKCDRTKGHDDDDDDDKVGKNDRAKDHDDDDDDDNKGRGNRSQENGQTDSLKSSIQNFLSSIREKAHDEGVKLGKSFKEAAKKAAALAEEIQAQFQEVGKMMDKLANAVNDDNSEKADKIEEKINDKLANIADKFLGKLTDKLSSLFSKAEEKGVIDNEEAALQAVMDQIQSKYGDLLSFKA